MGLHGDLAEGHNPIDIRSMQGGVSSSPASVKIETYLLDLLKVALESSEKMATCAAEAVIDLRCLELPR